MPETFASPPRDQSPAIAPLGPVGRAVIRCRAEDVDAVSERLGIALPREACRSAAGGGFHALWLGPDEWLILGRQALEDGWSGDVAARLDDVPCSVVDVSHRQVALSVHGRRAEDILSSGCALDLCEAAFPVGMCTRTMFAKAEILLWRTAPDSFQIDVWRSFAPYVEALLRAAENEAVQGYRRAP